MKPTDNVFVAGHGGLLGTSLIKILKKKNYSNILTKSSKELDLRNPQDVDDFFSSNDIDVVILAAAKVGNIKENTECPVEFLSDNVQIELNVINAAFKHDIKNLLFVSSSCIYPQDAKQPLKEKYIFSGTIENRNEAYGLAKLVGLKLCQYYNSEYGMNYVTAIPTNLYGENDKFDPEYSHVVTGVMSRMHYAKINNKDSVTIWGSGNVYREFLHVDDAADAIIFILETDNEYDVINIGTGIDLTIKELVEVIKSVVKFEGELIFDINKPDGIYKRQLNIEKLDSLGWKPKITLEEGIFRTYGGFLKKKGGKL